MSFKAVSASFSLSTMRFCATLAISAEDVAIPFWARAFFTTSNCASGVVIS